jgi:hypothetical protein
MIDGIVQGIGTSPSVGSDVTDLLPKPTPGIISNGSSTPFVAVAKAPYDTYSQGSLSYPLLRPFFEEAAADGLAPVSYTCSGAGESVNSRHRSRIKQFSTSNT